MEFEGWTRDLLIFLATAGIVVPLFGRVRVGVVLGFLLAGVVLGPNGLGSMSDEVPWLAYVTFHTDDRVAPFADLGVMFLLFTIGLELSVERLWQMRRLVFGAGTAQIILTTLVLGGAVAWVGIELSGSVVLGLGLAFSSTAIVLQTLIAERRLGSEVGQASLGILLMQDIMVVPGVILVTILAGDSGEPIHLSILRGLGLAVAAVVVIVIAGRFLLRPLLAAAASTKSREIMVAIALLLAIGAAMATEAAGLSTALGAFLAGLILGSSEYRHQVEVDIEPFKGLLLGLFFMTVGMGIDLGLIADRFFEVAGAIVGIILVKGVLVFLIVKAFRLRTPTAIETAFLLSGVGEFAFVLLTLARQEGLLDSGDLGFATTVAATSMVLTPLLAVAGRRIGSRLERKDGGEDGVAPDGVGGMSGHVVIGGYGRIGEVVAQLLEATSTPYLALDLDSRRVKLGRDAQRPVYFGDISRHEILEKIGGGSARAFVITSDLPAETERTIAAIQSAWPEAQIYARAKDPEHARRLLALGVADAVPEAFEGSLELGSRVLLGVGLPMEAVDQIIDNTRRTIVRGITAEPAVHTGKGTT